MLRIARCGLWPASFELLLEWRDWIEARAGEWPFESSCLTPFAVTGGDGAKPLRISGSNAAIVPEPAPPNRFLDSGRGEDLSPLVVFCPLIPAFTRSCCLLRESLSILTPDVLLLLGFEAMRSLILSCGSGDLADMRSLTLG